jgi:hypothetical protein
MKRLVVGGFVAGAAALTLGSGLANASPDIEPGTIAGIRAEHSMICSTIAANPTKSGVTEAALTLFADGYDAAAGGQVLAGSVMIHCPKYTDMARTWAQSAADGTLFSS